MVDAGPTPGERKTTQRPTWLAPTFVILLIAVVVYGGRKKDEIVENPLVDFAVLTVGVFAFAAVFRWTAVKLGAPGLAVYFGGTPSTNTAY